MFQLRIRLRPGMAFFGLQALHSEMQVELMASSALDLQVESLDTIVLFFGAGRFESRLRTTSKCNRHFLDEYESSWLDGLLQVHITPHRDELLRCTRVFQSTSASQVGGQKRFSSHMFSSPETSGLSSNRQAPMLVQVL